MGVDTCNCGARLVPSVRYDQDGQHETLACFEGRAECRRQRSVRNCEQCWQFLNRKQSRFCSRECGAAFNTQARIPVTCPCGVVFDSLPWIYERGKGRFCSHPCASRYRRHAVVEVA